MEEITLKFTKRIDYLHMVTSLARETCATIGDIKIDSNFRNAVELCVNEACVNAIKHSGDAYTSRTVNISFCIFDDRLVINLKEQGPGYDIDNVPIPEIEKHPESGYGIYLIKAMMDKVEYERENNWNILSMTKYFQLGNEEQGK